MIFTVVRWIYVLPILFLIFSSSCLAQEESLPRPSSNAITDFKEGQGLPYPGIIHIHSNISEGVYSPRRLVGLAQDKGIKILVLSDSFLRRWEYGLPIFSSIFKVSIEENSVVKYGIRRYLEDLKKIKEEFPDMLILEGVEVTPFYWWSGSFFQKNLTLNDWNRHLLVIGLKKYQDYAHLPIFGNRYFLPQLKDMPYLLIPVSLIILGIFLLKKRKQRKFLGLTLNVLGSLLLFNSLPFSASRYNPYHGQKQFLPYQDLINYVHKKGGLVFWAHPEITERVASGKFAKIDFYTPSYPEALILTSGYMGFGVNMLPGTSHNLILAGGDWDRVLMGYCQGKRDKSVWAIGELDYRGKGRIDVVQNIFLLSEFKPESVYEALRNGRIYIRYYSENNIDISLDDFHIEDSQGEGKFAFTPLEKTIDEIGGRNKETSLTGFMGDEIKIIGKPRLHIKGNYKINPAENLKIEVIRNGKTIKEFEFGNEGTLDLEFQDDSLEVLHRKSYYRLNFFAGSKIILVTNPIFVETLEN